MKKDDLVQKNEESDNYEAAYVEDYVELKMKKMKLQRTGQQW